jgi:hypothetical protein
MLATLHEIRIAISFGGEEGEVEFVLINRAACDVSGQHGRRFETLDSLKRP